MLLNMYGLITKLELLKISDGIVPTFAVNEYKTCIQ